MNKKQVRKIIRSIDWKIRSIRIKRIMWQVMSEIERVFSIILDSSNYILFSFAIWLLAHYGMRWC